MVVSGDPHWVTSILPPFSPVWALLKKCQSHFQGLLPPMQRGNWVDFGNLQQSKTMLALRPPLERPTRKRGDVLSHQYLESCLRVLPWYPSPGTPMIFTRVQRTPGDPHSLPVLAPTSHFAIRQPGTTPMLPTSIAGRCCWNGMAAASGQASTETRLPAHVAL